MLYHSCRELENYITVEKFMYYNCTGSMEDWKDKQVMTIVMGPCISIFYFIYFTSSCIYIYIWLKNIGWNAFQPKTKSCYDFVIILHGYIMEGSSFHICFVKAYIIYLNSLSVISFSKFWDTWSSVIAMVEARVSHGVFNLIVMIWISIILPNHDGLLWNQESVKFYYRQISHRTSYLSDPYDILS